MESCTGLTFTFIHIKYLTWAIHTVQFVLVPWKSVLLRMGADLSDTFLSGPQIACVMSLLGFGLKLFNSPTLDIK